MSRATVTVTPCAEASGSRTTVPTWGSLPLGVESAIPPSGLRRTTVVKPNNGWSRDRFHPGLV